MMSLHMGAAGSVADGKAMAVYLLEQQIPSEAMRAAAYYGQTPGIEDVIAAGYGAAPLLRNDVDPVLADALGLKQGQAIGVDELSRILSGQRADGTALPVQHQHRDVRAYGKDDDGDGKLRHRVAYLDLTLSAPKHVQVTPASRIPIADRFVTEHDAADQGHPRQVAQAWFVAPQAR